MLFFIHLWVPLCCHFNLKALIPQYLDIPELVGYTYNPHLLPKIGQILSQGNNCQPRLLSQSPDSYNGGWTLTSCV